MTDAAWNDRLALMVGAEGLAALEGAHVMVIGIGGVGSACAEALVRGGVGTLTFVEKVVVEQSNLNRQIIAFMNTVGRDKVAVMEAMAKAINPAVHVHARKQFVLPDNLDELFAHEVPDFVIDCQDTVATKLALAVWCEAHNVALTSAMGAGNRFDPTRLAFADIYDTSVCPLCRVVRKRARAAGVRHLRVLYSTEPLPERAVAAGAQATKEEHPTIGTMSYLPPVMGQMLAADCICTLAGIAWE